MFSRFFNIFYGGGGVGGAWVASFTPGANPGRDGPGYMNAYTVCEFEITILRASGWICLCQLLPFSLVCHVMSLLFTSPC